MCSTFVQNNMFILSAMILHTNLIVFRSHPSMNGVLSHIHTSRVPTAWHAMDITIFLQEKKQTS